MSRRASIAAFIVLCVLIVVGLIVAGHQIDDCHKRGGLYFKGFCIGGNTP